MKFFYENKGQALEVWEGTSLEFGAHLHTHLELVLMREGTTRVIVDSREALLRAGEALLVFPNQIHQYFRLGAERYLIAIFPPELCPEYQALLTAKAPRDPVLPGAADNPAILFCLERLLALSRSDEPFLHARVKGYVLALMGEVLRGMTFIPAGGSDVEAVRGVLRYCMDNCARPLSLQSVSEALHMNKYYISHLFSQRLHMRFCDYVAQLRVGKACEALLDGDESITDIAYQAGFNSPRSFNRLFLRQTGMTPRDYRKNAGKRGNAENGKDAGERKRMEGRP